MIVRPNCTSTSFNMLSSPSSKHLCLSTSFHPLLHTPLSPSLLQLVTSYPAIIHSGSCLSLVPLVSSTSSVLCQSPFSLSRGWEADSYNYPSVCEMNHWVGDWAAWWETSILSRVNEWAVPPPHLSISFSLSRSLSFSHFSFHLCGCFLPPPLLIHNRVWQSAGHLLPNFH